MQSTWWKERMLTKYRYILVRDAMESSKRQVYSLQTTADQTKNKTKNINKKTGSYTWRLGEIGRTPPHLSTPLNMPQLEKKLKKGCLSLPPDSKGNKTNPVSNALAKSCIQEDTYSPTYRRWASFEAEVPRCGSGSLKNDRELCWLLLHSHCFPREKVTRELPADISQP